jgi:hypothetical protein
MLAALRVEARLSTNVAHGLSAVEGHKYLLSRVQDDLYLNYDWPHLKSHGFVTLEPGQRYAAYPDNTVFESVEKVYAPTSAGSDKFEPLKYGVGVREYSQLWPEDADDRRDRVLRWTNYVPSSGETNFNMFEVWPVPRVQTRLIFRARRMPAPLTDDAHVSTLDGPAIILHAAAELLAGQKAEDAQLKLSKAQERIRNLKLRQTAADNDQINLSGSRSAPRGPRFGLDYVE